MGRLLGRERAEVGVRGSDPPGWALGRPATSPHPRRCGIPPPPRVPGDGMSHRLPASYARAPAGSGGTWGLQLTRHGRGSSRAPRATSAFRYLHTSGGRLTGSNSGTAPYLNDTTQGTGRARVAPRRGGVGWPGVPPRERGPWAAQPGSSGPASGPDGRGSARGGCYEPDVKP